MSDLVQRLRGEWAVLHTSQDKQEEWLWDLRKEAAARIEALTRVLEDKWFDDKDEEWIADTADRVQMRTLKERKQRIETLEAALRQIAAHSSLHDAIAERIARRALEGK